jgi:sugar phosphate isomerase/epimerase
MKISIVTDEISSDLETAMELASDWGIHYFELRGYGSQRVPVFTNYQKQRVLELMEEYQAQVIAISPGLFKIPYPSNKRERFPLETIDANLFGKWRDAQSLLNYHRYELLPASLEYAKEINAKKVVIFSFDKSSSSQIAAPDEVLICLQDAVEQAQKLGIELVIEVEDHFWADTGMHTAEILRKINNPYLGVNWDPGNSFEAGEKPFPDGYQSVRGYVKHVHFKDIVLTADGKFQYTVNGQIDWAGQIKALCDDGYIEYISVEPHLQPKISNAKAVYQRLRSLIEKNSSEK